MTRERETGGAGRTWVALGDDAADRVSIFRATDACGNYT